MNIFISYRREDTRLWVERLFDRLTIRYGREAVFKDIGAIPIGSDFLRQIDTAISKSEVFLAIIGKSWLTAAHPNGRQRLMDIDDPVRNEIQLALSKSVPIIPILVDGAHHLIVEQLPHSIQTLANLQATQLRSDPDFSIDIERLTRLITEQSFGQLALRSESSTVQGITTPLTDDDFYKEMSVTLSRDPNNAKIRILRAQMSLLSATQPSGTGFFQAFEDFRYLRNLEPELADPHLGLGTIYFYLSMFDIVERGRYRIHEKGRIRHHPVSKQLGMFPPKYDLSIDDGASEHLRIALDEFTEGLRLRQDHAKIEAYTSYSYLPEDINRRIKSLRRLLGHEPSEDYDEETIKVLTVALGKYDSSAFAQLFDISDDATTIAHEETKREEKQSIVRSYLSKFPWIGRSSGKL